MTRGDYLKIGFIGAGKVGKALGLYFATNGLVLAGYYSKTIQSAQNAAELTKTQAFKDIESLANACDIVFITTPDQALEEIDREVLTRYSEPGLAEQKTWIHVSGAHSSECLKNMKRAGCPVGSMHPLLSFGDPVESARQLANAVFSVEGTKAAVETIRCILEKTGGRFTQISAENKPLYHAGACVISNYMVALLDSGIRYFEAAGMERSDIFEAVEPLITATLKNIREKDTVDALTGPIVRGDFNTIKTHLVAIEKHLPSECELYKTMASKTVDMISGKRIDQQQAEAIRELLKGT